MLRRNEATIIPTAAAHFLMMQRFCRSGVKACAIAALPWDIAATSFTPNLIALKQGRMYRLRKAQVRKPVVSKSTEGS